MVCKDVGEDFVSHFCWEGAEERALGLGVLRLGENLFLKEASHFELS